MQMGQFAAWPTLGSPSAIRLDFLAKLLEKGFRQDRDRQGLRFLREHAPDGAVQPRLQSHLQDVKVRAISTASRDDLQVGRGRGATTPPPGNMHVSPPYGPCRGVQRSSSTSIPAIATPLWIGQTAKAARTVRSHRLFARPLIDQHTLFQDQAKTRIEFLDSSSRIVAARERLMTLLMRHASFLSGQSV